MIKLDCETKKQIQTKLTILEETLHTNISELTELYDMVNQLSGNPEISNIVTKIDNIRNNKVTTKNYVSEFKQKTDLNLEQIIALDKDISDTFGGW